MFVRTVTMFDKTATSFIKTTPMIYFFFRPLYERNFEYLILETWFLSASKENNPTFLVFEIKTFETKRCLVSVIEGGNVGISHVFAICTFIFGIQ